jgi:hypothetical protein
MRAKHLHFTLTETLVLTCSSMWRTVTRPSPSLPVLSIMPPEQTQRCRFVTDELRGLVTGVELYQL